jgi:transaldolase
MVFTRLGQPDARGRAPPAGRNSAAPFLHRARGANARGHRRQVADSYLRGLERRAQANQPIERIASVASLFVSRVDTKVDKLLAAKIEATDDATEREWLQALQGRVALANAKMMYQQYKEIFGANERWQRLKQQGIRL